MQCWCLRASSPVGSPNCVRCATARCRWSRGLAASATRWSISAPRRPKCRRRPGPHIAPVTRDALEGALRRTAKLWSDRKVWTRLQVNGMSADVSWTGPAAKYAQALCGSHSGQKIGRPGDGRPPLLHPTLPGVARCSLGRSPQLWGNGDWWLAIFLPRLIYSGTVLALQSLRLPRPAGRSHHAAAGSRHQRMDATLKQQ